jgi:hypothetical protein
LTGLRPGGARRLPRPHRRPTLSPMPAALIVCGAASKPAPCETNPGRPRPILRDIPSVYRAKGRAVADKAAHSRRPRLTTLGYLAGAGTEQHPPAASVKPGAGRKTGQGTSARGGRRVRHGDRGSGPQAGQRLTAAAVPGVKDLRWWPGASPSLTSGPFPWLCRLCSGPPAFAVNPRWGYARQKFRKIRFRFFVCGPGTFLPASGAL